MRGPHPGGRAGGFVLFKPRTHFTRVEARVEDREVWRQKMEEAKLVVLEPLASSRRLKFRLNLAEAEQHKEMLKDAVDRVVERREASPRRAASGCDLA